MGEPTPDPKSYLHEYLRQSREVLLWKLDGLSEYDVRRPLVPTGTNLLGLVKHLACCEAAYFGTVFGRPFPQPMAWDEHDADPDADLWATADESRQAILDLHRRACAHADATIKALPLDAPGEVAWWRPGMRQVTLHRVLAHMIQESARHAGHADILREQIDGAAGLRRDRSNLGREDAARQREHVARVEAAARRAAGVPA